MRITKPVVDKDHIGLSHYMRWLFSGSVIYLIAKILSIIVISGKKCNLYKYNISGLAISINYYATNKRILDK